MKELRFPSSKLKCVATIGVFDGVHRGHIYLLEKLKKEANFYKLPSLVITFWPDPERLLKRNFSGYITDLEQKKKIFSDLGIDYILILKTNKSLLLLEGEKFLERIFRKIEIKSLVVGEDFSFGYKAKAGLSTLLAFSFHKKFKLIVVKKRKIGKETISSSLIRDMINKGKFRKAETLLGRKFVIQMRIISGKGLGKKIGFPTLNLRNEGFVLPSRGVYAVKILNKKEYLGVCNIGFKPTVSRRKILSVEVHILNLDRSWSKKNIKMIFLKRLREEKKFPDIESLKKAIQKDIEFTLTRYRV
ncbi:MAG: riboflavin biosynthesis protein RibF [Candidatus Omnitrophica bacterium 4484_70.1]|nr:MAG: riboflavin biosynthesis protein RibF [Candidatus Omnitrophica bacterium 4484_70.1]